jgi:hypothetical protein
MDGDGDGGWQRQPRCKSSTTNNVPGGRWEREVPAGMLTTTTSTLDNALMLGEWMVLLALLIDTIAIAIDY